MRPSFLLISMTLLGVLVLAACGGNDAGDQTTTTTTVADETTATTTPAPTGPVVIPEFAFPVPDGATRVITSEPGLLELAFPGPDAEQIAGFYEDWTGDQDSWTIQESNPVGVIASFLADNGDSIDVLRETPDSETLLILSASAG